MKECRIGYECDSSQNCVRSGNNRGGSYNDDGSFCSARDPCPRGQTCCSDGRRPDEGRCSRSRSCTCSRSRPEGTCPLGEYCEGRRGDCRRTKCSSSRQCPTGEIPIN